MRRIYIASDPIDAELIRSLLGTYGIEALVRGEHLWSLPGVPMTPDGAPSVWVAHDEDDPRARAIIDEHRKAPMSEGSPWHCRICEEENDGAFSNCWKCAATGPDPGP